MLALGVWQIEISAGYSPDWADRALRLAEKGEDVGGSAEMRTDPAVWHLVLRFAHRSGCEAMLANIGQMAQGM